MSKYYRSSLTQQLKRSIGEKNLKELRTPSKKGTKYYESLAAKLSTQIKTLISELHQTKIYANELAIRNRELLELSNKLMSENKELADMISILKAKNTLL